MAYSPEELYSLYNAAANPTDNPVSEADSSGYALVNPGQSRYYHTGMESEPTHGTDTSPIEEPSTPFTGGPGALLTDPTAQIGAGITTKQGGGIGESKSVSYKGTPDAKISQRDREVQTATAQADATAQAQYAPALEGFGKAKESATDAAVGMTDAVMAKTLAEGRQAQVLSDIQQGFMNTEMHINASVAAKAEEAKADYMTALADFRASRVNPSQLWDNMGVGQRFGTLVSVFAHDFLGAQGIKTSAMDTLNKAIDRNIQAQIEGIKIKGQATEGFKTLWDMQRAQSASDAEARARVRGFMLESVKQGLIAQMSTYDTALVSAQGKQALAKIDAEYAKTVLDVYGHIAQNATALRGQAIDWAGKKLQADQQAYATATSYKIHQEQMAQKRADAIAKMKEGYFGSLIPDVSPSGKGEMKWRFREGIDETLKREALGKVEGFGNLVRDTEEYRSLIRQHDSINDLTAKTRFADTNAAKMRELQIKILLDDTLRRTGKAATDSERHAIESRIPLNTWATQSDVEQVAAGFEKHGIADMDTALSTVAYQLSDAEKQALAKEGIRGASGGFAAKEKIDAEATYNKDKVPKQDIDQANALLEKPNKFSPLDAKEAAIIATNYKRPADEWAEFIKSPSLPTEDRLRIQYPKSAAFDRKAYSLAEQSGASTADIEKEFKRHAERTDDKPAEISSAAGGVVLLAGAAAKGDPKALAGLRALAGFDDDGHSMPQSPDERILRLFAQYEYSKIKK